MREDVPSREEIARVQTRASLLARLKNLGDNQSWRSFFDTYWRLIYGFAIKRGLSPVEAEEVVQETVIVVAKKIQTFVYDQNRAHFQSWLFQIADNMRMQQLHKRKRGLRETGAQDEHDRFLEQIPDPSSLELDTAWEEEWERNLLSVALERSKHLANPREYQIFEYSDVQGHSPEQTHTDLEVPLGTVYSAIHRMRKRIKDEVKRLREKPF